jgi:hypothetical protein
MRSKLLDVTNWLPIRMMQTPNMIMPSALRTVEAL